MTASSPDVNLCKTVITALLAGYPTPILVNWGKTFGEEMPLFKNSHIGKVAGVHDYLQRRGPARDEDMVLVVDGYDIWFQMGPQLLLDRYEELCRKANQRIDAKVGSRAAERLNIRQRIVFGAQKECWPGTEDDLNCYAVPNSTLPQDIYGSHTDQLVDDAQNPSIRLRQRYLSSGVVLGTLGDMRRLYERAMAIYAENNNIATEQALFSRILGEQEFQREVTRLQYNSPWRLPFTKKEASILDPHPSRIKMDPVGGSVYEYGIGLDYASFLSQATVFADRDVDWVVFNDTDTIAEAYDENGVVNPGSPFLNRDISLSLPPFWSTTRLDMDLPLDVSWSDVNLFTNLYTGVTPAIIHLNAHQNNLKSRRETHWDMMWFQPKFRGLLRARLHEPYLPIAVTGHGGAAKAWWGPVEKRANGLGAQPDTTENEWLPWDRLADRGWLQEIFRDGEGPWREAG